ncbi:MAG: SDR family oxidoreductase [Haliea sp.]|nr:SDR family oxidoreductase [Haliea sp.]
MQTKGSIVNAASTAALSGLPCGLAYSASKGGVLAMTRSIAVEYAKRGVRANCVCPGDINTGMTDGIKFPKTMDFELMPRIISLTGAKAPEVVAGVIAMLVSMTVFTSPVRIFGWMAGRCLKRNCFHLPPPQPRRLTTAGPRAGRAANQPAHGALSSTSMPLPHSPAPNQLAPLGSPLSGI